MTLLAENREKFEAVGTTVIGSSYDLCEMSLDKFEMYNWLAKNGYKCAKSYMDKDAFFADVEVGLISYPVFVKPARGSASISISKAYDKETVELLFAHEDGLMIQEFLNGQEIGADVYIDMVSHEIVSIFTKKKLKMRAGETDMLILSQSCDSEPLGKYGRMRLAYLKNQRPVLYNRMLLNGTLWPHLLDAQKTACAWLERTMTTLLDKYPAPDKERAQLLWVAHMNGLKAQAEEVVVREVVYAE